MLQLKLKKMSQFHILTKLLFIKHPDANDSLGFLYNTET